MATRWEWWFGDWIAVLGSLGGSTLEEWLLFALVKLKLAWPSSLPKSPAGCWQAYFCPNLIACFCVIFSVYGCMLCLVCYLFVISTSVIDCLIVRWPNYSSLHLFASVQVNFLTTSNTFAVAVISHRNGQKIHVNFASLNLPPLKKKYCGRPWLLLMAQPLKHCKSTSGCAWHMDEY